MLLFVLLFVLVLMMIMRIDGESVRMIMIIISQMRIGIIISFDMIMRIGQLASYRVGED